MLLFLWPGVGFNVANKEMGVLSTLLRWNDIDPPSREEKLRNERICKLYQHNRNPFVDHPEYANLIWERLLPSPKSFYTRSKKDGGLTDSTRTMVGNQESFNP